MVLRVHLGRHLLVAFLILPFAFPIRAAQLQKLSLPEMVEHADLVVAGRCEKSETAWLGKKIYTIATVRVTSAAKGQTAPGQTLRVHILGGRVREPIPLEMYVEGTPQLAAGEEMVLFLQRYGDQKQFHRIVGLSQGKLSVTTDPKTGEKLVHHPDPIKGVRWLDKGGKPVPADAPDAKAEPAKEGTLEGFLGRVQKIHADQTKENEQKEKEAKVKTLTPPNEKGGTK